MKTKQNNNSQFFMNFKFLNVSIFFPSKYHHNAESLLNKNVIESTKTIEIVKQKKRNIAKKLKEVL